MQVATLTFGCWTPKLAKSACPMDKRSILQLSPEIRLSNGQANQIAHWSRNPLAQRTSARNCTAAQFLGSSTQKSYSADCDATEKFRGAETFPKISNRNAFGNALHRTRRVVPEFSKTQWMVNAEACRTFILQWMVWCHATPNSRGTTKQYCRALPSKRSRILREGRILDNLRSTAPIQVLRKPRKPRKTRRAPKPCKRLRLKLLLN